MKEQHKEENKKVKKNKKINFKSINYFYMFFKIHKFFY